MTERRLIGPFSQLVTLDNLPAWGAIHDEQLHVIPKAGIAAENGIITEIGDFASMRKPDDSITEISCPAVALPGFIDAHTHICFAGTRARDYALRLSGHTYQEIAAAGGGILDTVRQTRAATQEALIEETLKRANQLTCSGVATCEVKSGYGLSVDSEIKMLEAIRTVDRRHPIDLVPTCLAAHTKPEEFRTHSEYLLYLQEELFPLLLEKKLSRRIDIFVEQNAFSVEDAEPYLLAAKEKGFQLILHADQFSRGGAQLAAKVGALSADHLEASTDEDFKALRKSGVIPIMLPGATLGLGMAFPHARKALDCGLPLVIASDWNPGSAPMGDLLTQAALLGVQQKLTIAETLAAITVRAAKALQLEDRGSLAVGQRADFSIFSCDNYQEILYHQGTMKPTQLFIQGREVKHVSISNFNRRFIRM